MGLSGSLRTMGLSELLQWIGLGQKTGTVIITGRGIEKKIFFSEGRILSSSSSDPREYLGHFLVSHGYITEEELAKAMQVQEESNILLGKILVMIGAITEPDLMRLMRLKVEESIYDIFLWDDGDFRFIDHELPEMKMVPLSVDVTGIIMEGGRRWDEWRRIRERIPDNTAVPTIVGAVPTEEMSEHDRYILPFLDGRRSIEEIAVQTHNTEFHVAKLAYELVRSGQARIQTAAASAPASPATAGAEPDEVGSLLAQAAEFTAAGNGFHAWKAIRAALEIDPQSKEAREALREAEQRLLAELESAGITGAKVPSLAVSVGEVTKMNFSPNEGFVLSRINGSWDIKSILKISPIREIDALLIFRKLLDDGVIVLR